MRRAAEILRTGIFLALALALLGCAKPKPPTDVTALRKDLIELDQSLRAGISQGHGLHQAAQVSAAIDQLERDYRLELPRLNADQRLAIEANLSAGQYLMHAASLFVPYASYDVDHTQGAPRERWTALQTAYNLATGTNQLSLPTRAEQLLAKISPAP